MPGGQRLSKGFCRKGPREKEKDRQDLPRRPFLLHALVNGELNEGERNFACHLSHVCVCGCVCVCARDCMLRSSTSPSLHRTCRKQTCHAHRHATLRNATRQPNTKHLNPKPKTQNPKPKTQSTCHHIPSSCNPHRSRPHPVLSECHERSLPSPCTGQPASSVSHFPSARAPDTLQSRPWCCTMAMRVRGGGGGVG
jgi:hypothetical protein